MSDCNSDRVVIEGGLNMSELYARVSVNITFVFANNEVFTLAADGSLHLFFANFILLQFVG